MPDELQFYVLFISISDVSGQWEGENEKLGAREPYLWQGRLLPPVGLEPGMDGWMTCDFTSCSTVFQYYQDNGRLIMKGCVQWNSFYSGEDFASSGDQTWSTRSVGHLNPLETDLKKSQTYFCIPFK